MKRSSIFLILLIALVMGMFSEAHDQREVRFFEMLRHTDGQFYNQPFTLLPWQKQIIRDVYGTLKEDGTRQYKYVYLEIPKKNGKSELAAGAALYHLFADGEMKGEIYGCAADRGQASIVYQVARDMIDLVPALSKRAKITDSSKKDCRYGLQVLLPGAFRRRFSQARLQGFGLYLRRAACAAQSRSVGRDDLRSRRNPPPADLVGDHHRRRRSGPGQHRLGDPRVRLEDPLG